MGELHAVEVVEVDRARAGTGHRGRTIAATAAGGRLANVENATERACASARMSIRGAPRVGAMLMTFGASFNSPALFATILTIVLLAVALLSLIQYLDRRLTPWRTAPQ